MKAPPYLHLPTSKERKSVYRSGLHRKLFSFNKVLYSTATSPWQIPLIECNWQHSLLTFLRRLRHRKLYPVRTFP